MKTQAWGWLTAAVLAAGLNASYHDGGMEWAHQIVDRVQHGTGAVLALATGNAGQFLTEARFVATPRDETPCRFAAAMARVQNQIETSNVQFDDFQVMSDREVAQLDRLQANRSRIQAQLAAMRVPVVAFPPVAVRVPKNICPRVRVNIPKLPRVKMPAIPEIHIDAPGAGPV